MMCRHDDSGRCATHYLERTVLWSNAAMDKDVIKSLEAIRDMAIKLKNSDDSGKAFREKPVVAMSRTLVRVGEYLDRPVRIDIRGR